VEDQRLLAATVFPNRRASLFESAVSSATSSLRSSLTREEAFFGSDRGDPARSLRKETEGGKNLPPCVLAGTATSVRAAAGATAGGMDGNVPVRLPGREGDGSRQVHHAEGRRGRRRGQAGSFGAAAKLAATTDSPGEVRGRPGQAGDRGSDRAAYTGP